MKTAHILIGTANLVARSVFHIFISGALYLYCYYHYHTAWQWGTVVAFLFTATFEYLEPKLKIDNTFCDKISLREIILLIGSVFFTSIFLITHKNTLLLWGAFILLVITTVMRDHPEVVRRSKVKPYFDIASITLGPLIFYLFFA